MEYDDKRQKELKERYRKIREDIKYDLIGEITGSCGGKLYLVTISSICSADVPIFAENQIEAERIAKDNADEVDYYDLEGYEVDSSFPITSIEQLNGNEYLTPYSNNDNLNMSCREILEELENKVNEIIGPKDHPDQIYLDF